MNETPALSVGVFIFIEALHRTFIHIKLVGGLFGGCEGCVFEKLSQRVMQPREAPLTNGCYLAKENPVWVPFCEIN